MEQFNQQRQMYFTTFPIVLQRERFIMQPKFKKQ